MAFWAASGVAALAQSTSSTSSAMASAAGVTSLTAVAPVANACQRFAPGSVVQQPPALFSKNGVLPQPDENRIIEHVERSVGDGTVSIQHQNARCAWRMHRMARMCPGDVCLDGAVEPR